MPPLRRPLTQGRALMTALIILAAGCGTSAPEPGTPHPTTSSAVTVYTLAESGDGKPGEISHGKPMDIDWDAASGSFFVSTYNDGTIYRGRLNDPNVPVYIEGTLDQMTEGITVARGLLYATGGTSGQIRVYNLVTKAQVGHFDTGSGGELIDLAVTDTGDVWATDGTRPVLWHLTPQQVATGSGTPTALPITPEVAYSHSPNNLTGIVAMTNQRLLVVNEGDGALYRIDLDSHTPRGRTITQISGADRAPRRKHAARRSPARRGRLPRPVDHEPQRRRTTRHRRHPDPRPYVPRDLLRGPRRRSLPDRQHRHRGRTTALHRAQRACAQLTTTRQPGT